MSFSQGLRVVSSLSKRHVGKIWIANHRAVSLRTATDANSLPVSLSVCNGGGQNVSRLFSSDSQDTYLEDKKLKLKNDPEIKAWMSQITQDFENEPFRDLVQNEPHSQPSQHTLGRTPPDGRVEELVEEDSLDIEVEDFGYIEDDEDDFEDPVPERSVPVSLERGRSGVFDVEEVVAVLKDENGVDIQVIDIPPEARFVDHMVVVSGKSLRHMRAMAASIEWLYKRKKKKSDRHFKVEGRDCNDWLAMDLGNIAVHIFTPEARQHYDLETLWTLGPEHDDQRHYVYDDTLNLSAADLFWLESSSTPNSDKASSSQPTDMKMFKGGADDGNISHTTHLNLKTGSEEDHVVHSLKNKGKKRPSQQWINQNTELPKSH